LKILGIVFIVEHVVLVGVLLVMGTSYAGTQKEAEAYVNEKVAGVFRGFAIEDLEPEISSAWKQKWPTERNEVAAVLQSLHEKMGDSEGIEDVAGETKSSSSVKGGASTVGNFRIQGNFENGEGMILVSIVKEGEQWKINSFTLNSPLLEIQ
jgi:hypothetical protein